jgi:Na+/H+-dicarboxylate symporter
MAFLRNMMRNIPLQLFMCLMFALFFGSSVTHEFAEYAFTASNLLKDLLMHFLPLLVFSYIAVALGAFHSKGFVLVIFVIVCTSLSNALTVFYGYIVGGCVLPFLITPLNNSDLVNTAVNTVHNLWQLPLRPFIQTDKTMLVGAVVGLYLGIRPTKQIFDVILKMRQFSTAIFKKCFIPLLPIYVLGFLLKIAKEDALWPLVQRYTGVFAFTCIMLFIYLFLMYIIASGGKTKVFYSYIKEMLPAGITGFSTVSSAATMPITIGATERTTGDANYADFCIPATVNVHLIGDGISISITALALMLMHGSDLPSISAYAIFVFFYCLAKFSCAGGPGGGVLVLIPVFQQNLGMSPEVAGLLASIYVLQDPILTSANVMGNGAFAIITHKIAKKVKLIN